MRNMKSISVASTSNEELSVEELPEGWIATTLNDLVSLKKNAIKRGPFGSAIKKSFFVPEGYKIYEQKNVIYNDFKVGNYFISQEKFRDLADFEIHPGDFLISCSGTIGKIALVPSGIERGIINQALLKITLNEEKILPKYFFFLYKSERFQKKVLGNTRGSAMQNISSVSDLKKIPILLPPLAEQEHIVARVEALLSQVNAARERLSRVPLIMKKFRQAVLAAACEGRLTEEWRESCKDIETSSDLFSKIQTCISQKYFESCENAKMSGGRKIKDERKNKKSEKPVIDLPELPDTWNYFRLEELSHLITDGTHITPEYLDKGIPFLSVKNVRPFSFRLGNIKLISPEEHYSINQRCNPELHDILYTKVGSYGYAVQNNLKYPFSLFVSVALIKPVKEYFIPDYVEIVMNSPKVFEQAIDRISGSGTPDLHLIEIRDFRIPLPPLAEQHEIVRRVNALFERADQIEQQVVAAIKRTEALTQAVLGKAFRGELR